MVVMSVAMKLFLFILDNVAAYVDEKRELLPTLPLKVAKQTALRSVRWDLEANVYSCIERTALKKHKYTT